MASHAFQGVRAALEAYPDPTLTVKKLGAAAVGHGGPAGGARLLQPRLVLVGALQRALHLVDLRLAHLGAAARLRLRARAPRSSTFRRRLDMLG